MTPVVQPTQHIELEPGCWIELSERFVDPETAARVLDELSRSCAFEQHALRMFGREILEPRLTAWCGDAEYRYSGRRLAPGPWPDAVLGFARRLERERGLVFNHVLMNLYRSGEDSMGYHADDEPELGQNPTVAALSLGNPRRFVLRPKARARREETRELALGHGSLLVMGGATQHRYQHAVPKTRRVLPGPRLSLTFRHVVPPCPHNG